MRCANPTCLRNKSMLNRASFVNGFSTYEYRLIANKRQLSYGHNGISPHGLVETVR